ncbi:MAG: hypothetical protein ACYSTS_06480 [Planctomycetota bacterium]|jgi:hypothetical protein
MGVNMKYSFCLLLIIGFLLNGCNGDAIHFCGTEEEETEILDKRNRLNPLSPIMRTNDSINEIIILLSNKYSISEDTLIRVLEDYRQPQLGEISLSKMSIQYNITRKKLASVIIDYRSLIRDSI